MKNKLYHYFNNKENSNDLKKQFFKNGSVTTNG